MNKDIRLTFCSGVGSVTGANFLLEVPNENPILVDCGMIQGEKVALEENYSAFPYKPADIGYLLITHAHLDHVGRIPKLVKEGFVGKIFSTPETRALAEIVLVDAVSIIASEAKQNDIEPLYNADDVANIFSNWEVFPYHENFSINGSISVYFKDAGHILGSAMIELAIKTGDINKKILFTGDLGNSPSTLLRDTENIGSVDCMIMESVYGDRNHEDSSERTEIFENIIKSTIAKGGTLVIPAFSIDRTQALLYELNNLVENKQIPRVPIFVDSPMAIKTTEIYKKSSSLFNDKVRKQIESGDNIFEFPRLEYTITNSESKEIEKIHGSKIILAGSGMSVGGRVISHEADYLPDSRNTILLVGYQSLGSLGRQLADGAKKVTIHGREIKVNAEIKTLLGYSAHKGSDDLVDFVGTADDHLKRVFVVMGEIKSSMYLAQRLNDTYKLDAIAPERNKPYIL
jgi:metallo-beta-lactamase family protein